MVGASLTALTVNTNVSFVLAVPSLTVTVMVAVPNWFAAGVSVTVLFAPLPPKTMLPLGISVGFEEEPVTIKLAGSVSASPIVNEMGPSGVSSAVTWLAMSEIVGG